MTMFYSGIIALFLTLGTSAHEFIVTNPIACQFACRELSDIIPSITSSGSSAKVELWSLFQAHEIPQCRVAVESAQDVGTVISTANRYGCRFSVLAGGTSAFRGASNSHGGITIDLRRLKKLAIVDADKLLLSVGAGNVWADVYRFLDSLGASAVGTRNSLTGVTGSILGGGISFFSRKYGWSCDMVLEMEVVLANSTVVMASRTHNSDLFWALRGGGNNFGVVTNVVIQTFRNPPQWYIFQVWETADQKAVFERLEAITANMPEQIWQVAITLEWHIPTQRFVLTERRVASDDMLTVSSSDVVSSGMNDLADSLALHSYSYSRSILAMSQKMDRLNPSGKFNFFGSTTVINNATIFDAFSDIFQDEVETILGVPGVQVYVVYNPVTESTIRAMGLHGGNALGINTDDGPLMIININLRWLSGSDTPQMRRFIKNLIYRFRQAASDMGGLHRYIFQNHAFEEQDVFTGYGLYNLQRLHSIQRAVDPKGVFQLLQPGYFKLGES